MQLVEMLNDKCGEQTSLVNGYKRQIEQENSKWSKYIALVQQVESLR